MKTPFKFDPAVKAAAEDGAESAAALMFNQLSLHMTKQDMFTVLASFVLRHHPKMTGGNPTEAMANALTIILEEHNS